MICCVQVVPDLAHVAMTMSSSRNLKSFHTDESKTTLWISRVFAGHLMPCDIGHPPIFI